MEKSRNSVVAAIILLLVAASAYAQRPSNFEVVRGRQLALAQNPDLREIAAEYNERVNISITGRGETAIVSEQTNAVMDCRPFLQQFPGGSVAWYLQPLDILTGEPTGVTSELIPGMEGTNLNIMGEFNDVLEIIGVLINPNAEDPTSGNYICEVCIARDFPALEDCHNATVTVFGIGDPPLLNSTTSNAGPFLDDPALGVRNYLIGADACLNNPPERPPDPTRSLAITCDLLNDEPLDDPGIGAAFPNPNRIWEHNGVVVYDEVNLGNDPFTQEFRDAFPDLVSDPLFSLDPDGGIIFQLALYNTTRPSSVRAYDSAFGEWTCTLNNTFGTQTATSRVRICGDVPVLPFKPPDSPPVVADSGDTVPIGCDVCLRESIDEEEVTLDLNCTVIEGTPPLNYTWDSNTTESGAQEDISNDEVLTITEQGRYNCAVENIEGLAMASSVVRFVPRTEFTITIITARGEELKSDGCDRLRRDPVGPVDVCLLVGDTVEFLCDFVSVSELNTTIEIPNGNEVGRNFTIETVSGDNGGNYSCIFIDPSCGPVVETFEVRVYDPARINRTEPGVPLPGQQNFGAGTVPGPQVVTENTAVLFCPTMGIPNPSENWRRIVVDERGRPREERLMTEGNITITLGDLNGLDVVILTIPNFGPEDEGTYVCRTKNIAGVDAGTVTLQAAPESGQWVAGNFSNCSLPCHLGVRTRTVSCRSDRDNRILPDTRCMPDDRPNATDTTSCDALGPCFLTPFWKAFDWGPCSRGCAGGFRTRTVECIVPLTREIVSDVPCLDYPRPPTFEFCPVKCCTRDVYPIPCRTSGTSRCDDKRFQQFCCWTCKLRVIP